MAGEDGEVLFLNPTAQPGDVDLHIPKALLGPFFALGRAPFGLGFFGTLLLDRIHLDGSQAHLLQASQGLSLAGNIQLALLGFPALGVQRLVLEGGHICVLLVYV